MVMGCPDFENPLKKSYRGGKNMKKLTFLLLCMVLSMFCVNESLTHTAPGGKVKAELGAGIYKAER